jgi:hypothetical protein
MPAKFCSSSAHAPDVRRVGAFAQALQKTAAHTGAAVVLDQAGQQSW